MAELLSLKEAISQRVYRLRKPIWHHPMDHIQLSDAVAYVSPWVKLYCPFNLECNGRDPVWLLRVDMDAEEREWEPYLGPLPDSDEYKAAQAEFDGVLKDPVYHKE